MTEQLLQYGVVGLMAAIFAVVIIIIDKRQSVLYKKLEREKDKQIEVLEKRLEKIEDKENQRVRDTHEIMSELNKTVASLVDIAAGFKALANLIVEQLNKKPHS